MIRAAVVLTLVGCAVIPTVPMHPRAPEVTAWHHPRAVVVVTACLGSPRTGSGVAIAPNLVLTAAHVVACTDLAVLTVAGRPAVVFAEWPERDTALLVVQMPAAPVRFGPRPRAGDRVCAATAWPAAVWSCGNVLTVTRVLCRSGFCSDLRLEVPIRPGNSGGGLFDAAGALIGLITGNTPDAPGGQPSFAISLPLSPTE